MKPDPKEERRKEDPYDSSAQALLLITTDWRPINKQYFPDQTESADQYKDESIIKGSVTLFDESINPTVHSSTKQAL